MSAVHDGRCSPWVMCSLSEWQPDSLHYLLPLGIILYKFGITFHCNADDTHLATFTFVTLLAFIHLSPHTVLPFLFTHLSSLASITVIHFYLVYHTSFSISFS